MKYVKYANKKYLKDISKYAISKNDKYRKYSISIKELSKLGDKFSAAVAIVEAAQTAPSDGKIYRCVFPDGVQGALASSKDGSGLLGAIINEKGIAGQARWIPAEEAVTTAIVSDPVALAIAAAMVEINRRIGKIQKTQFEILRYLQMSKESEVEGSLKTLYEILNDYKYNNNNESWKAAKFNTVSMIKDDANKKISFYHKEITGGLHKQKAVHGYQDADKLKTSFERSLKYYKLSISLYAFASFLEVILGGNFDRAYLDSKADNIRKYSIQYKADYKKCYEQLEYYMKGSFQAVTLNKIGKVGTATGKALNRIPIINKGSAGDALMIKGLKIKKIGANHGISAMRHFRHNQDDGIRMFMSNIDTINVLSNQPLEVLFNKEKVFISTTVDN